MIRRQSLWFRLDLEALVKHGSGWKNCSYGSSYQSWSITGLLESAPLYWDVKGDKGHPGKKPVLIWYLNLFLDERDVKAGYHRPPARSVFFAPPMDGWWGHVDCLSNELLVFNNFYISLSTWNAPCYGGLGFAPKWAGPSYLRRWSSLPFPVTGLPN